MKHARFFGAFILALLLTLAGSRGHADLYPPADHGGEDLVLALGDSIWGEHTNINRFIVPIGATVTVRPYTPGVVGAGVLEIQCNDAYVSGTIDARGAGSWGGGGGGGGGGSSVYGFTGQLMPGEGGHAGEGVTSAEDGLAGGDGAGAFRTTASGGNGGTGGRGAGIVGGGGGPAGRGGLSAHGSSAGAGGLGGYAQPGINGDASTHMDVFMGSGGGGGGGGAGGGAGDPGQFGKIAGGGGGSGAAGGNGGGGVKIFALGVLHISGGIDTRGAVTVGPQSGGGFRTFRIGNDGDDGAITLLSAIGGNGGDGADAAAGEGVGTGGLGGKGRQESSIGIGYDGGSGGSSGAGAGGGILLSTPAYNGIELTSATLDLRGGTEQTLNGGTIKIFYNGPLDPTSATAVRILAGRVFKDSVARTKRWQRYE